MTEPEVPPTGESKSDLTVGGSAIGLLPYYPWEGGDSMTDVRVFMADEKDEDGQPLGQPFVGLGDYVDEGQPDLIVMFPKGTDEQHVRWVAMALEWFIAEHPGCCVDDEPAEPPEQRTEGE